MTNYREILRLHSLGLNKTEIASSCQCARNTVAATLQRAANCGLQWPLPEEMSDKQLSERLFPTSPSKPVYKMPDYAYVHKELQRSGITLNLLWLEYCDQCRAAGEIPYQSTQFNKYYADYLTKVNATMHLNHKPGEVMQVDWAGDTAAVIDTDTGEIIPAYVFVATLPYSGYSYVEAFFSMNQDSWTTAHVNAYKYFGGVTRIIQCDNLKTGVQKHGKDEVVLNKSYQELAEHQDLLRAMAAMAERSERRLPPKLSNFQGIVGLEPYPVTKKAAQVLKQLLMRGVEKFCALFRGSRSRSEIVATFLAVLELCRVHSVRLEDGDDDLNIRFCKMPEERVEHGTDGAGTGS